MNNLESLLGLGRATSSSRTGNQFDVQYPRLNLEQGSHRISQSPGHRSGSMALRCHAALLSTGLSMGTSKVTSDGRSIT